MAKSLTRYILIALVLGIIAGWVTNSVIDDGSPESAARLTAMQTDTLLIAGCVTSGCVRASAVDASQYGFRPLVVREAVGDRSPLANEANLLDIEARYGDVVSIEQAREYLSG